MNLFKKIKKKYATEYKLWTCLCVQIKIKLNKKKSAFCNLAHSQPRAIKSTSTAYCTHFYLHILSLHRTVCIYLHTYTYTKHFYIPIPMWLAGERDLQIHTHIVECLKDLAVLFVSPFNFVYAWTMMLPVWEVPTCLKITHIWEAVLL